MLELKIYLVLKVLFCGNTFNRTMLELKKLPNCFFCSLHVAFNRTMLELKIYNRIASNIRFTLLIVPCWN